MEKNKRKHSFNSFRYVYTGDRDFISVEINGSVDRVHKGFPFYVNPSVTTVKNAEKYKEDEYYEKTDTVPIHVFKMPSQLAEAICALSAIKVWSEIHIGTKIILLSNHDLKLSDENIEVIRIEDLQIKPDRYFDFSKMRRNKKNILPEIGIPLSVKYFTFLQLTLIDGEVTPKYMGKLPKAKYDFLIDISDEEGFKLDDEISKNLKTSLINEYTSFKIYEGGEKPSIEDVMEAEVVICVGETDSAYIAGYLGKPCVLSLDKNRIYHQKNKPVAPTERVLSQFSSLEILLNDPTNIDILATVKKCVLDKDKKKVETKSKT